MCLLADQYVTAAAETRQRQLNCPVARKQNLNINLMNTSLIPRPLLVSLLLLVASSVAYGQTCESIQSGIDARIRSSGVDQFTLKIVDADAPTTGKVVGTCDRGSKKIVYLKPGADAILTECKDGSITYGGDCKK